MSTFTIEIENPKEIEALVLFLKQLGLKYAQKEHSIQENAILERRKRLKAKNSLDKKDMDRVKAEKIIMQGISNDFDTEAMLEYPG